MQPYRYQDPTINLTSEELQKLVSRIGNSNMTQHILGTLTAPGETFFYF